jgi:dolichol-phosphate mannosyltransferase
MAENNILIFIPTYNEAENVENIFQQIKLSRPDADILFLDDNSPDGTGKIIDSLVRLNPGTFVIHRSGKLGIGSAHLTGIEWAYEKNYKILITMDCDFTHSPEYIHDFLKNSEHVDIVIGSRYMQKASLAEWNLFRKSLTHFGHFLTKHLLGLPYDASGAFRLYHLSKIDKNIFKLIIAQRYSFFFESLFILNYNKNSIREIPIHLPSRTYGTSKMTWGDAWNSLSHLFRLYRRKLFRKSTLVPEKKNLQRSDPAVEQEWDEYWAEKNKSANFLYDIISRFYRKYIIRKILNYFIRKHLSQGQHVLHAGCGSGQVDTDVASFIKITALDISGNALSIYKKIHGDKVIVRQGNIFDLPFENNKFDGVYNLGVLEHFTQEEIIQILVELKRVLKTKGRIVILWPPEFGVTVFVLDSIHFILNKILRLDVKLHPAEITRLKSRSHAISTFERAGFKVIDYYFGAMDFYTQAVIVGEKSEQE